MLTNPPFVRQKDTPPFHLRDTDAEEMAQWRRMREAYENLFPKTPQEAKKDESGTKQLPA